MAENRYLDVYEQYHDRVQDFIGKKIRNEPAAEDMTQDIFLLVYRKWNELADHPNIAGYMMSAAKFHIYKWYDRQRRLVPEEEEILMLLSNGRSRESETDAFRMADFYLFAESVLPKEDINVLKYYYMYGYTAAEMAQKLGISVSCFKARVARMKKELTAAMHLILILLLVRW